MENTVPMTVIYGVVVLAAFILMVGYWRLLKRKEQWLQYLSFSVLGINVGYFCLSISDSLQGNFVANGIVSLFSVLFPFFILMAMLNVCEVAYSKKMAALLILIGALFFLLVISGMSHFLYGVYGCLYLAGMLGVLFSTMKKGKRVSCHVAVFLMMAVLCNVFIWWMEQLLKPDFEFLSVSYVFTELFLLIMFLILEEVNADAVSEQVVDVKTEIGDKELDCETDCGKLSDAHTTEDFVNDMAKDMTNDIGKEAVSSAAIFEQIQMRTLGTAITGIEKLSVREMEVLLLIMDNKRRKDIAEALNITENTVKKHTSHIFSKLGISSRKELFAKCQPDGETASSEEMSEI